MAWTAPIRITITAAAGKIVVTASDTQTAALTITSGYYDLELYSGTTTKRLLQGTITVDDNITT